MNCLINTFLLGLSLCLSWTSNDDIIRPYLNIIFLYFSNPIQIDKIFVEAYAEQ